MAKHVLSREEIMQACAEYVARHFYPTKAKVDARIDLKITNDTSGKTLDFSAEVDVEKEPPHGP